MKASRLYRRLASAHHFGLAEGGWHSLHLAADHLLLRSLRGFVEEYRRFYLRDIEAFTICKTLRGGTWNAVWGIALFFSVLFLIFRPGWPAVICTNLFGAFFLINLARGATCLTTLQTRVQTRRLPLRRVKKALKVLQLLQDKIAAAQADLPVETVPIAVVRSSPPPLAARDSLGNAALPPPLPGEAVVPRIGWVHFVAFAMILLGGALALAEGLRHRPALMFFTYAAIAATVGWSVAALVSQRRRRVPARVQPIAWIAVIGHAFAVPTAYMTFTFIYTFTAMKLHPVAGQARPAPIPPMNPLILRDMAGFSQVLLVYGALSLLLGLVAFVLCLQSRGRPNAP